MSLADSNPGFPAWQDRFARDSHDFKGVTSPTINYLNRLE